MKEVYRFQDVVLLSDKELARTEASRAWFADGSVADLDQLAVLNRGTGDIAFEWPPYEEAMANSRSETFQFQHCNLITLQGGDLYFDIQQSDEAVASLELVGTDRFHASVEVYEVENGLAVETPERRDSVILGEMFINGRRVKGDPIEGRIVLKAPAGASVYIQNGGAGVGRIHIPLESLNVKINGSMNLECESVSKVDIEINGSADVRIKNVTAECSITINGSGSVDVGSGELPELRAHLNGSGSIIASVIANKAELVLRGSGSIQAAQVVEESYEVHGGSGSVRVLKRGNG